MLFFLLLLLGNWEIIGRDNLDGTTCLCVTFVAHLNCRDCELWALNMYKTSSYNVNTPNMLVNFYVVPSFCSH